MKWLQSAWAWIVGFLGPPVNAIRGYVNLIELGKAIVLGLLTGGGVLGVLEQMQDGSGMIFPSPTDDALVAGILAFLMDFFRRLPQGRSLTSF